MPVFEYETHLPFARSDVFGWYTRPGALVRLHPPFAGVVEQEPSHGLEQGSESTLGINLPGLLGTSVTAVGQLLGQATPVSPRTWMRWQARHTQVEQDQGFTDDMVSGPAKSWTHTRTLEDDGAGTLLREQVEYELPVVHRAPKAVRSLAYSQFENELHRIFRFREHQTAEDLAFHQSHGRLPSQEQTASTFPGAQVRTVAVSGASGLVGRQVCALLSGAGITVRPMVRRSPNEADVNGVEIPWDPSSGALDPASLEDVDAVIHLAGHPLAARFTDEHKRKVMDSRVEGTELIAGALAEVESASPRGRALINGSAIGYYGATPQERTHQQQWLTEDSPAGTDFLAQVCQAWEAATHNAREAGVRVAMVRTGIVQSPAGGVLQQLLPLFAAGVGGPLGRHQWQSWISVDDIASLFVHAALDHHVEGPVNGVAPEPVTAAEYAHTLGAVLRRPAKIPVPSAGPALILGREGAKELALADQRVRAEHAQHLGFGFRHHSLSAALHHVIGR